MRIRTAQMVKNSRLNDGVDITVKSGLKAFAPSWDIVMAHKRGDIVDEEYTLHYRDLMRASLKVNRQAWIDLLSRDSVTLLCYCKAHAFCHRYLLVEYLQVVGESMGMTVEYDGEVE